MNNDRSPSSRRQQGQAMTLNQTMPPPDGLPPGLFAEAVRQSPIAISITDEHANIIYVNKAFTEITGYSPAESLGRNESMLSDCKTPRQVYHELWGHLKQRLAWRGRLLNRHRDGRAYLAELTVAPILDAAGNTTHYIGMHRDITEVYQLQQESSDQKRLIETMVDSMPMAAVLLDESGRIVLDNLAYKKLDSDLGLREPSHKFLEIIREEMGEEWEKLKARGLGFRNREVRYERGGQHGTRWFSCSGTWFKQGDGQLDGFFEEHAQTYLLLMLNDITQQKKREEEMRLNALSALMAEEERIQGLREALLCAIHHIQGPINLLQSAKALMRRRGQDWQNPALLDILEQIMAAGEASLERLKACVPEAEEGKMGSVNLNQLLHETLILLTQRLLAAGIVIDWKPAPLLPSIMGRDTRLRALFKQLIENAIDAMNQSGVARRELRVTTWADAELIHVTIDDTGPGIPESLYVKAFEPFFSTRNTAGQRHQGMGLTMAQDVVNQHGGLIHFDTHYREGCRVHIQMPGQQARPARPSLPQDRYAHG